MYKKMMLLTIAIVALGVAASRYLSSTVSAQKLEVKDEAKKARRETPLNAREEKMRVEIATVAYIDGLEESKTTFTVADNVRIRIFITNTGDEDALVIIVRNMYEQYLPILKKDGVLITYKPEVEKSIQIKETRDVGSVMMSSAPIKANERMGVKTVFLKDWYGQLEAGRYELAISYRHAWRKKPVRTNTVDFEVVGQNQ